jgi:DNA polymerase
MSMGLVGAGCQEYDKDYIFATVQTLNREEHLTEYIVQAISRDILCYAMRTLSHCMICAHVHDELIIECREDVSLDAICEQMGRTPPWAEGLVLRADGYCTPFYKKD